MPIPPITILVNMLTVYVNKLKLTPTPVIVIVIGNICFSIIVIVRITGNRMQGCRGRPYPET